VDVECVGRIENPSIWVASEMVQPAAVDQFVEHVIAIK
jgi:hypothetical protein